MTSYHEIEIKKYLNHGLLIDTNLYLLLLVGRTNMEKVGFDKRTQKYVIDDYFLLENTIGRFDKRYTTPNIITETSNLLGDGKRTTVHGVNRTLADDVKIIQEEHISSFACVSEPAFFKFGITDAVISLIAAQNKILVLTDDLSLYSFLSNIKLPVLNFNHFRQNLL